MFRPMPPPFLPLVATLLLCILMGGAETANAQDLGGWMPEGPTPPSKHVGFRNGLLPFSSVLGLTGQGIDILVWESGVPMPGHFALDGADLEIVYQSTGVPSAHATQVVGAILARGSCQVHGTAQDASVHLFQSLGATGGVALRLQQWEDQLDAGVGLLSNWSFTASGNDQHFAIETLTHAHPEHLLITGTGNPPLNRWNIVSNCHKNALVVGSINFQRDFSYGNSARGPTSDGRIKPDLVEYGHLLRLPGIDNSGAPAIRNAQGSSMACALVAGQSALVQESAVAQGGAPLRGDMLKAVLILTADDLGPTGPDFQFGFGQMQVDGAVEFITRVHQGCPRAGMHVGELVPGQVDTVAIPQMGDHPLKACLVWMDPPDSPYSRAVVNDLNLTLNAADGDLHHPWALPHASVFIDHPDSLSLLDALPAVRQPNHIDNVELIEAEPGAGDHILTIAHDGDSTQHYALAWMEVMPAPWSLPADDAEAFQCMDPAITPVVQDENGSMWDDICGSALPTGAYCAQSTSDDGCHALASFDVRCASCPGDLNGDGTRSAADFIQLLGLFESHTAFCLPDCMAFDIVQQNQLVFVNDILAFLGAFGTPCP